MHGHFEYKGLRIKVEGFAYRLAADWELMALPRIDPPRVTKEEWTADTFRHEVYSRTGNHTLVVLTPHPRLTFEGGGSWVLGPYWGSSCKFLSTRRENDTLWAEVAHGDLVVWAQVEPSFYSFQPKHPAAEDLRYVCYSAEAQKLKPKPFPPVLKPHLPLLEQLWEVAPWTQPLVEWLLRGPTMQGLQPGKLLAAVCSSVADSKQLLKTLSLNRLTYGQDLFWLQLPPSKVLIEEAQQRQKQKRNAAKLVAIANETEDMTRYARLHAAVVHNLIPPGVFKQTQTHQPINVEYKLWEKALSMPGWAEVLYDISHNAAARSTYERDITSYISFLFQLPRYLDRHAPRPGGWQAMPVLVEDQFELEMEESGPDQTVKRRSKLTPVADNETGVVTVPYATLHMSGDRAQWCYSRHYHIFQEGMLDPVSQTIVQEDLELKLNGRDDYGLCYYTLTGTDTARGYPTFLIIFERLTNKTRVHFHRVHPSRYRDKMLTPASRLIQECYRYMAGNVPATEVTAQQGDLIFTLRTTSPVTSGAKIAEAETALTWTFESHAFSSVTGITLHRSTAATPKNRLGFLYSETPFSVRHLEHEDLVDLPGGWYEIRRCKSWEANPVSIWSRTID